MRSVPSRARRVRFGDPSSKTIQAAQAVSEGIDKAQTYAELVFGAKKVLDIAEMELTDAGTPPEGAIKALASAREKLRKWDTAGMVSFHALFGLTAGTGTGDFLGTSYGAKAPTAKDLNNTLKQRIDLLGEQIGMYAPGTTLAGPNWSRLNAPVGASESFLVAAQRWKAEDDARIARPATAPAYAPPVAAPMDLSLSAGTVTASAGPGGASVSVPSQPAWLVPALVATAATGVALLLLPNDAPSAPSYNRGSRARNLDYGRFASDAQEGRMIRSTLRNLEGDARAMRQMLKDDDDLPQWVHAKVQTSADRVNAAHRYLRAKIQGS